jgi:maleate cis-trans isomerase
VSLVADIEDAIGVPVVSADVSLYWAILRTLGVVPIGRQGSLLASLQSDLAADRPPG